MKLSEQFGENAFDAGARPLHLMQSIAC
jgi:hypothetical protein